MACGLGGETCQVCPADFEGYKWSCENQDCVKDTPTGPACTSQTEGATCTDNLKNGVCRGSTCCVGCYDSVISYCFIAINTYDATTCGINGVLCENCTKSGKVCSAGKCVTGTTDPCSGKSDLDPCTATDGKTGTCIGGTCCTGCYYSASGTLSCAVSPSQSQCGKGGASCKTCEAFERCSTTDATCTLDPDSTWELKIVDAYITNDPQKKWDDVFISAYIPPDPYVGIIWAATCSQTALDICTGHQDDTFNPKWQFVAGTFKASQLMSSFCMKVQDADDLVSCSTAYDDVIGQCVISMSEKDLRNSGILVLTCENPKDGKDYIIWVDLTVTHVP